MLQLANSSGGDGYDSLKKGVVVGEIGQNRFIIEIIRDYIVTAKRISPRIEGRLERIDP